MRKLQRRRTTGIPKAFRGLDRVAKNLDLLKTEREIKRGTIEKHEFPSNWSPAKNQLHKESSNKCAYCEAPTTLVAYGDVEHYRPKSTYWWFAYCYENYLPSCTLCNQKYKKAKFDVFKTRMKAPRVGASTKDATLERRDSKLTPDPCKESEGMRWSDFAAAHKKERPLLLNPYLDDPREYCAWEVDHTKGHVKFVPKDSSDSFQKKMVNASERDLGINRKELCVHRYDRYIEYAEARLISEDPDQSAVWRHRKAKQRKKLLQPDKAFSGMLHYFETLETSELSLPPL